MNSFKYKHPSSEKEKEWSPHTAEVDQYKRKKKREDEYLGDLATKDRPVLLVKKKHAYLGMPKDEIVEGLDDKESFFKVTNPTQVIEDATTVIKYNETFISRHTVVHIGKQEVFEDSADPNVVYKIEGVEFLPEGFIELDPLLYKNEYSFKHSLDEKLFTEHQRRIVALRRKQYKQRNQTKMREVTIYVKNDNKEKLLNYMEEWYHKNQRMMNEAELKDVAEILQTDYNTMMLLQEAYLRKKQIHNIRILKDYLHDKGCLKEGTIDVPKSLKKYFVKFNKFNEEPQLEIINEKGEYNPRHLYDTKRNIMRVPSKSPMKFQKHIELRSKIHMKQNNLDRSFQSRPIITMFDQLKNMTDKNIYNTDKSTIDNQFTYEEINNNKINEPETSNTTNDFDHTLFYDEEINKIFERIKDFKAIYKTNDRHNSETDDKEPNAQLDNIRRDTINFKRSSSNPNDDLLRCRLLSDFSGDIKNHFKTPNDTLDIDGSEHILDKQSKDTKPFLSISKSSRFTSQDLDYEKRDTFANKDFISNANITDENHILSFAKVKNNKVHNNQIDQKIISHVSSNKNNIIEKQTIDTMTPHINPLDPTPLTRILTDSYTTIEKQQTLPNKQTAISMDHQIMIDYINLHRNDTLQSIPEKVSLTSAIEKYNINSKYKDWAYTRLENSEDIEISKDYFKKHRGITEVIQNDGEKHLSVGRYVDVYDIISPKRGGELISLSKLRMDSNLSVIYNNLSIVNNPKRVSIISRDSRGMSKIVQKLRPTLFANEYYNMVVEDLIDQYGKRKVSIIMKNDQKGVLSVFHVPEEFIGQTYYNQLIGRIDEVTGKRHASIAVFNDQGETIYLQNVMANLDSILDDLRVSISNIKGYPDQQVIKSDDIKVHGYNEIVDNENECLSCFVEFSSKRHIIRNSKLGPVLIGNEYYHQIVEENIDNKGHRTSSINTFNENGDLLAETPINNKYLAESYYSRLFDKVIDHNDNNFIIQTVNNKEELVVEQTITICRLENSLKEVGFDSVIG